MNKETVSVSKELGEPEWLLKERAGSLAHVPGDFRSPVRKSGESEKKEKIKQQNVRVLSLGELLKKDAKFARRAFLSRKIRPETSAYAAYLGAHFTECGFLFIDKGKKAELELSLGASLAVNFIFVGEGASLRISATASSDCMDICEIRAEQGARVDCAFMKQKGAFSYRGLAAALGTGSSFNSSSFWSGNGYGTAITELAGVGSCTRSIELSTSGDSERLAIQSSIIHSANNTKSEAVMRGVAQDSSETKFNGRVTVEGGGKGSKSSLSQQILLLDKGARAEADPVLEIKNNDVDCSHAAAVRQLDEEKLFYLQTRGLNRETARTTMVAGFLRSAIDRIEDRELRNRFKPQFMQD